MNWFKEHRDTIAIIATIIAATNWMNMKCNDIEKEMEARFATLEKDIAIIKTVLIMKNIMPSDMACHKEEGK